MSHPLYRLGLALTLGLGLGLSSLPAAARLPAVQQDEASVSVAELPQEARTTLGLIRRGGPFRYPRDGVVFGNYEKRLPREQRGYYREYTVPTPGEASRGARRIIAGAQPPEVFYYTADHYRTFRRIRD
ncbi:MAG TPA: ribonuclease domain-containing protein [Azospira sp.]|nr:ribonuclease domain-containing protein [Azospira sp.]